MYQEPLSHPIRLYNIDGMPNEAGSITHKVQLKLRVGKDEDKHNFLVTSLGGTEKVILGLPWLQLRNPHIDWQKGEMRLASTEQIHSGGIEVDIHKIAANRLECHSLVADGTLEQTNKEIFCLTSFTYTINTVNLSTQIAIDKLAGKTKKTFEEMVPLQYHDYKKVFSEEESQRLLEHQPWDHTIDLIPDAKTHWKVRTYPLSPTEQGELDKFLKEHLTKGYLVPCAI